jgi:simple sugar transport system permease protein
MSKRSLQPVLAMMIALAIAAAVIWATGGQPGESFVALGKGALGDTHAILRTLAKATPLIFSGLAVALGLRGGLFNIGAEGQLLIGGIASAWTGFAITGLPMYLHLPLAILVGALAGGLWGLVPGLLKAWRGTHEVIVTIMMNYMAIYLTRYLVNHPLKDHTTLASATPIVLPTARLWSWESTTGMIGTNFSAGFGLALLAALFVSILLRRTPLGFEIRAVGLSPEAARTAGIHVGKTFILIMSFSGALAGLAGAVEVLGVHHRFYDQFSPGYGFDSIAVALLGGLNALGVTLAALLFGALNSGAIYMETLARTPRQIIGIIQAVVILAVGARYLRKRK